MITIYEKRQLQLFELTLFYLLLVKFIFEIMMKFNKRYFLITSLLFLVEIFIALVVKDKFVRPYVGDYLVVILIYAMIKSFFKVRSIPLAVGVLLFAYGVEFSQYFNLINLLHLSQDKVAQNVMGNSFSWNDMIAYTLGILTVVFVEKLVFKSTRT